VQGRPIALTRHAIMERAAELGLEGSFCWGRTGTAAVTEVETKLGSRLGEDLKAFAETVGNLWLSPGLSDILLRPVASQVPFSPVAMFPAYRATSSSSWRTTEEMRWLVGFATETEPDLDEGGFIDAP
jgi:hypothetical protein